MPSLPLPRASALCFAVAAATSLVAPAAAQVATAINQPIALGSVPNTNPAKVFLTSLATGSSTEFFDPLAAPAIPGTAPGFQGLAADEAGRRLFAITTNGLRSDLYSISYDTRTATFIAQCRIDPTLDNTVSNANGVVLTGLAYDSTRQKLYGTRSLQSGTFGTANFRPEGIYEIDLSSGRTTPVRTFEVLPASDYTIDGIDYDAATDSFFMADDDTTGGQRVYSLSAADLTAPLVSVFVYPEGVTDVDGLAVGGGKVFLLSDGAQGNGGLHRVYDLASGIFDAPIPTPYPSYAPSSIGPVNPSGGATWAPGLFAPIACSPADVAGGGASGNQPDGNVDGSDFIAFINSFSIGDATIDPLADIAGGGPTSEDPDGTIDGTDFIAFINAFALGC